MRKMRNLVELVEYVVLVSAVIIVATNSIRVLEGVNTTTPSSVIVIGIAAALLLADKISKRHKDV